MVLLRELKQDGIWQIFLRKLFKTDLYPRLTVARRMPLEISDIMSQSGYPSPDDSMEKRQRWRSIELLRPLARSIRRYWKRFSDATRASLTNPYRSARSVFRAVYNQDRI